MKGNRYHYARRMRQLRYVLKRIDRIKQSGQTLTTKETNKLKARLERLYHQLNGVLNPRMLRKALAGAALTIGITFSAQAQSFAPGVNNPFGITPPTIMGPTLIDIDNDGDLDIMSANYQEYGTEFFNLNFYENIGNSSNPIFEDPVLDPFGLSNNYLTAPSFVDIDNDGDLDLFAGGLGNGGFIYYAENTGAPSEPNFGPASTGAFGLNFYEVFSFLDLADFDNDGDFDIMVSTYYGNFEYFENTGTPESPAFGNSITNPFGLGDLSIADARISDWSDLDGDGDIDLMFNSAYYSNQLTFVENTGTPENPSFGIEQSNPFGLTFNSNDQIAQPAFGDLDSDGDIDLLVITWYANLITYFENTVIDNAIPTSAGFDITVGENDTYTFNESEFSFNDQDGEDLVEIEITTLPGLGALEVGGLPIPAGATVAAGDLGTMTFSPFANEFGTPYTSFEFRVSDGIQFSINTYTVTINVDENTATVELLDTQAVAISPNPTQDGLLVEANLDTPAEEGTIRILNTLGQEVRAFPLDKGLSKVQQWIDLNGLTNGTYFLELEADQAFWTGRFQKQ